MRQRIYKIKRKVQRREEVQVTDGDLASGARRHRIARYYQMAKTKHVAKTTEKKRRRRGSKNKAKTRRERKKRLSNFSRYIYAVLQQVHPHFQISQRAMVIMDDFMMDIFARVACEAGNLAKLIKRHTILVHQIHCAVKLIIPGELAQFATGDGMRAVTTYIRNKRKI